MFVSSLLSLIVAQNASSQKSLLFLIGIFTIYMILAGNAALSFKSRSKESASVKDYAISYIMLLSGILMVIMAVINWSVNQQFSILYLIFGGLGIPMSSRDISFYRNLKMYVQNGLHHHIGK